MSNCKHRWLIWPETDGQTQRCSNCGAYRATQIEPEERAPAVADKKVTDYVETLQLAIEQVQNPELREDASNALTALLQTWVQPTPQRDPMAELLARKIRELEENMVRFGHEDIQYDVDYGEPPKQQFWQTPDAYKMEKKTKEFVEVYAQGRARNKTPGRAKNLRP